MKDRNHRLTGRFGMPCGTPIGIIAFFALALTGCGNAISSSPAGMTSSAPVDGSADGRYCSAIVTNAFNACGKEVEDDYLVAFAKCINVSDPAERADCFMEAGAERDEASLLCSNQRTARQALCTVLGEDRYDPDFDPMMFVSSYSPLAVHNAFIPLDIGNVWEYESADETVTVEVLDQTKLIEGVTCIVVNDVVREDGDLVENTDDWFAQALDGDIYYCGEEVKDFEYFDGDDPRREELVSIDGSFKIGRDGARPGVLIHDAPVVGQVYRQEFLLGDAEDVAEVLSTTWSVATGPDVELDAFVPVELKTRFCPLAGDCLVTRDATPLEPDGFERKYYARGLGLFLETKPDDGEVTQLVDCNFDPRCVGLPGP